MADTAADVTPRSSGGDSPTPGASGLHFDRSFTPPGSHAYDLVTWERRTSAITNAAGKVFFEQPDVEVPRGWSQLAGNVVAQKYFHGQLGTPQRESSVRQLVDRVVDTLVRWGREGGYFATEGDAANWAEDLRWLIVTQHASFNSPVWFNIGVPGRSQQASACFINSVEDTMESILELAKTEGMLFKFGSGTGTNLSVLRSSKEALAGGGTASGPVSFMRGYDSFAGSIKSGGTTRRAAKMVILNADHPDILEFVRCKAEEEKKASVLIDAGYDVGFNVPGGAYDSVQFQNANHSVRVTDGFMEALAQDGDWTTRAVTDRRPMESMRAADLWKEIAESAWTCGDPGLQFDTTIQSWNCVPNTARINATNPCFTGDAVVHTTKGLVPFADLVARAASGEIFSVYTHDLTNPDHPVEAIAVTVPDTFMVTGYHEVVRLRFSNGMAVRCTPNHRFFTRNRGYVRADELCATDRVVTLDKVTPAAAARYELPIPSKARLYRAKADHVSMPVDLPQRWTPEFAHYLGWLVGDGCISYPLETVISVYGNQADQTAMMPAHRRLLAELHGGVEGSISVQPNGTRQIRTGRMAIARFLTALGLSDGHAESKVVPWSIMQAPSDIAAAFLRGLFDADGCVRDGGGKGRYVGLGSRSRELLLGVQRLLTTFGVSSRVYTVRRKAEESFRSTKKNGDSVTYDSGPQHDLRISAESMCRFREEVGFDLPEKAAKLADVLQHERYNTDTAATLVERAPDGVELTYNLREPRNHSYVVNGLVVANCSEFVFIDASACNLLSLNLRKYQDEAGQFDVDRFRRAIDICLTAQEILVSNASYPTPKIAANSEALRPLGLGYANLGALLMSMGHAYDSDEGRAVAGAVTAMMTGEAYTQSARMAAVKGPFSEFTRNRDPMLGVMRRHEAAAEELDAMGATASLTAAARDAWRQAIALGEAHGYRNAQVTVIAPTGTVALMMDCDTTGIEPDLALVKYKTLVGGGMLKMVNATVPPALRKLGYGDEQVRAIVDYIDQHDTIEGAPGLRDADLSVFDCAFRPRTGSRSIAPMGHVRMMASVQPFVSGSQSKTVNLPSDATPEDIGNVYRESWQLGLKCIAIYRDGCKRSQPLSTSSGDKQEAPPAQDSVPEEAMPIASPIAAEPRPYRRRLPDERQAITHKFEIQGHEGYITVGVYPDGKPGEVFITMAKEGSTISGLMDAFATQTSVALQYGVPLEVMVNKFSHMRFEPGGMTRNRQIPIAKSIVDYIFRWLASRFLDAEAQDAVGIVRRDDDPAPVRPAAPSPDAGVRLATPPAAGANGNGQANGSGAVGGQAEAAPPSAAKLAFVVNADAPACAECGSITVRSGTCYKCLNCGSTTGCS